MVRINPNLKE